VVFGKKTEHPGHRVQSPTQAGPKRGDFRNRALNQLSEGLLEERDSRGQGTPRSLEATRLRDSRRRVQTFGLDPRPLVEIRLQPLGADRPVGQAMRRQHREGQTARTITLTLDALGLQSFRIGVALIASMTVDHARTTARTHRARSFELIFAKLDRGASPKSSPDIKPLCFGLPNATGPSSLTNVSLSRARPSSQRYKLRQERHVCSNDQSRTYAQLRRSDMK
jgi:hypothetical protein